ncbi:MAG: class I SAM-dependent methyltransferase [Pyrinomonadaceae bacterium]
MGIKINRTKPRQILASVLYRLHKLPLSNRGKFKLFLNLEWIFNRLSHELSFKIYKPENHPMRKRSYDFILNFIQPEHLVLDLGCARGEITSTIAEKAKSVVGVDHNQELIDIAQKNHRRENLKFLCMDAIDYLKNTDEKFDILVLSHILEHIDEPQAFLEKFKNFFRYIYVEVPDFDGTPLNHYRKDLNLSLIYSDDDHVSEFDRYELQDLLKQCNLRILRSDYIFGLQRYWCEVI